MKPFSLQPVFELMKTRADDATRRLAQLIAAERDAKTKLDMLRQYRDEYAARFRDAAQIGLSQGQWRNYQDFLNRLDEVIGQQSLAVGAQERHTAAGQSNWQQQRTKLKAFDTLAQQHNSSEMALEFRREQKVQDEFSSRIAGKED